MPRSNLEKSRLLFTYKAHAMGANSISVVETTSLSTASTTATAAATITAGKDDESKGLMSSCWNFFITSGGDDQAITGCSATILMTLSQVRFT